jgi:hypothetical protein
VELIAAAGKSDRSSFSQKKRNNKLAPHAYPQTASAVLRERSPRACDLARPRLDHGHSRSPGCWPSWAGPTARALDDQASHRPWPLVLARFATARMLARPQMVSVVRLPDCSPALVLFVSSVRWFSLQFRQILININSFKEKHR